MSAKEAYRVKVKLGDATVEIEGAQEGVVEIVRALSEVLASASGAPSGRESSETEKGAKPTQLVDIRSFCQSKGPRSQVEAAAAVAFYYQYLAPEEQRRDAIDRKLLEEAFRKAKLPLPKALGQVLVNAKAAGYLDATGDAGVYKLNAVGYNLVEHTLGKTE